MASFADQRIPIVVLKDGTQDSQGKGQLISNINACIAIQDTIKTTLGPMGADKLIVSSNGEMTISNDGATIMRLLDIVHPAATILVDIAKSQDAETGDGTTTVVILAAEILKEALQYVDEGIGVHLITRGYRKACKLAVEKVKEIAVSISQNDSDKEKSSENFRNLLRQCAATAMSSKIIRSCTDHFVDMVVEAVLTLDPTDLNEKLIGIKKVSGGAMQDSQLVKGVAFKKTFSYAGFEQQPKRIENPLILCLNVELELKAEKDNAEVRIEHVKDYQDIVDAEWKIIFRQLESIVQSGARVVLSKLPIGDLATQYFADRNIFCAGRVSDDDMQRVVNAVGGSIQSTCTDIETTCLGSCGLFEERQIGAERYNLFTSCPKSKSVTMILRGGAHQFIAEVERSVHDAIMIVKCALRNQSIVAGGGAVEMELSRHLREYAYTISGKQQMFILSYAKALEVIPRLLCENAGLDSTDLLNQLRMRHAKGEVWAGIDLSVNKESVADLLEKCVLEPSTVKINALEAATEAAAIILSVDESIKNVQSEKGGAAMPQLPGQQQQMAQAAMAAQRPGGAVGARAQGGAMPHFR